MRHHFDNVNIKKLFGKTLWVELLDYDKLTGEFKKGRIIVPTGEGENLNSDFYRVGRVIQCADDCDESLKPSDDKTVFILLPPKGGLLGIKKIGKRPTIFVREDVVMAVIDIDNMDEDYLKKQKDESLSPD